MGTKAQARDIFLRTLDEATKKGVDLPLTKNADYRDKFNYFLDSAQKYIAGIVKIPEVVTFTQNPIPNLLGYMQGFDIVQILPGTPKVYTVTGAKSFYLEMDNVGTATIAVNGVTVQTINNTIKRQFTAYMGLITANSGDTVTLTFDGLYPYNTRNVALYGYTFPLSTDVPEYVPYVAYDMPSDFLEFDSVIIKSDPRVYESYVSKKWENNKKVILNYYDAGSFDIHYYKYPAYIAPDADDSTVLDIEDKAFELVVLQCGIMATAADNPSLSSWLRSLYLEKVQNITQQDQPIMNVVQTVFSIN